MSQRRERKDDDTSFYFEEDDIVSIKSATKQHRTWSWKLPRRKSKGSLGPIVIVKQPHQDLHWMNRLDHFPDTPNSSRSSLCSCEHHQVASPAPRRFGSKGPALCSTLSAVDLERRSPSPSGNAQNDGHLSPQPSRDHDETAAVRRRSINTRSAPNLLETVRLSSKVDQVPEPTRSENGQTEPPEEQERGPQEEDESLDNVQQLIRETDQAFGLGPAIAEVELNTETFKTPERMASVDSPTRSLSNRKHRPRKPLHVVAASPLSRQGSISKPKRRSSRKSRTKASPTKRRTPRWANNARALLNAHLFNRIEVDEVLPPSRLEEIRLCKSSLALDTRSSETLTPTEVDGPDTPVEPFHLQDLPSRIGAAGVCVSAQSPVEMPVDVFDGPQAIHADEPTAALGGKTVDSREASRESFTAHLDVPIIQLPARNPLRALQRKQMPPMPTIPETTTMTVASPPNDNLPPPSNSSPSANEAFVLLPSSPYTFAMPNVRHGSIRLSKIDLAVAYDSSKLAASIVDETLDWTAFQMAILGGAGDLFGETTDYSRQLDAGADGVDELCDWFDSFGFENPGLLIAEHGLLETAPPPRGSVALRSSVASHSTDTNTSTSIVTTANINSRPSISADESLLPIPVEHEHPQGFWNQGSFDASRFYDAQSFGLKRWAVEGHPKRHVKSLDLGAEGRGGSGVAEGALYRRRSAESIPSLPQSPMPDLMLGQDASGKGPIVPMGYNLGHDLGDFLRWEAEHVCFAGSPPSGSPPGRHQPTRSI